MNYVCPCPEGSWQMEQGDSEFEMKEELKILQETRTCVHIQTDYDWYFSVIWDYLDSMQKTEN